MLTQMEPTDRDDRLVVELAMAALDRMIERLSSSTKWTSSAMARTSYGDPCQPTDPKAVRWDVTGALIVETFSIEPAQCREDVRATVRRWLLNDEQTVSMVTRRGREDLVNLVNDNLSYVELTDWLNRVKKAACRQ